MSRTESLRRLVAGKQASLYTDFSSILQNDQYVVCISKNGSNSVVSAIDVRAQEVHFSAVFKEELFEHIFHPNGKYIFLAAENGKLVVLE